MDLIFMLTRNDRTVEDCLEVLENIAPLKIGHLGFKDVGVEPYMLEELNRRIHQAGGISHMELVSTDRKECLESARFAVEIVVDRLLGGVDPEGILGAIEGSQVGYYPFPGLPQGHPTRLGGKPERIAGDCKRFGELGCAGVDLLAFRAVEADPLELVRAARLSTSKTLIVAGSVDSPGRIRELQTCGVNAFTLGSAAFDGTFSPGKGLLYSQLRDVLAAVR